MKAAGRPAIDWGAMGSAREPAAAGVRPASYLPPPGQPGGSRFLSFFLQAGDCGLG
jgi:hypothetical protein